MKKILVIFTGGTIGSTEKNGLIDVDTKKNYKLISLYENLNGSEIKFQTESIMEVLSENITAMHWDILCNFLYSLDFSKYSGIIITHGSDTLAFTSAIVGMLFSHTEIPIILIASNLTLETPGANGLENFCAAVKHITDGKSKGVFTIFGNIYLSTRILPADSCLDKFSSYGDTDISQIFDLISCRKTKTLPIQNITFKNDILMIYGYPNINFSAFCVPEGTAAVLYVPYHSGTACTDCKKAEYTLTEFIRQCNLNKVPVYICGIKINDGIYVTLEKLIEAGAKPLYRISEVAAYAKLMIAYNQNVIPVEDFLERDIYFETTR